MKNKYLEARLAGIILIILSGKAFLSGNFYQFDKEISLAFYEKSDTASRKISSFPVQDNRKELAEAENRNLERELTNYRNFYVEGNAVPLSLRLFSIFGWLTGVCYLTAGIGAVGVRSWAAGCLPVCILCFFLWQGMSLWYLNDKFTAMHQITEIFSQLAAFSGNWERPMNQWSFGNIFSWTIKSGYWKDMVFLIAVYVLVPRYFFGLHKIRMQFELKRKYG